MKVLVINAGSSSMKFTLFQMEDQQVLAKGVNGDGDIAFACAIELA